MEFRGNPPVRQKKCNKCGFVFEGDEIDVVFCYFTKSGRQTYLSTKCAHCRQDEYQTQKDHQPWHKKAINTLKYHAKKFGMLPDEFKDKYGWNPESLAHKMEHAYKNGCDECEHLYSEMTEGLGALTVDHWDRRIPPYIENTRLMCTTCNKEKGTKTPEEWAIYKASRRKRDAFLAQKRKELKPKQLQLFQGDS